MEAGAYLGHKTIRFIDDVVGTMGKVLAIEMMPDNIEVLRKNIQANGLGSCINVINCGVWSSSGETEVMGKGRQRNSIASIDKLSNSNMRITVRTDSLDNILHSWGEKVIDFLALTLNGAEVEALHGLEKEINRIKVIYVAARYTRKGQGTQQPCIEILKKRGCVILPQSGDSNIYAATKNFAKEYVSCNSSN